MQEDTQTFPTETGRSFYKSENGSPVQLTEAEARERGLIEYNKHTVARSAGKSTAAVTGGYTHVIPPRRRRGRPSVLYAGGAGTCQDASGTRYVPGPNGGAVRQYSTLEALGKAVRSKKFARRMQRMDMAMRSVAIV